ncbi:sodium:proton antiporter [Neptunomonas phycophila]|uniref:Sodium:proton antiporter n=1 Tax=Neptunomonas phycophila TaxID=1572645 RepID=A0AAW7XHQ5_9GAMM|nr:sodium:proton antiporter [Neptunomonas phycophila]MDO6453692.1 sodium:proton antiporter [Neptunomonas phycophila]
MELTDASLLALIALFSLGCQWVAWRFKLPAILFLLLTGIMLGPVTHVLDPDELFGSLLFPLVSLSVAIILFEGSLTLHFDQTKEISTIVRRLVTWGALITWVLISWATHLIFDLNMELSALFGALVVVTGPTVIVPMLRTLRATSRITNVLRWEGIVIDPVGALLAVLVYQWLISSQQFNGQITQTIILFFEVTLVGTLLGAGAAVILAFVMKRHWLPEYLHTFGTLALVVVTFTLSNHLAHESGLLAVTVMGIWLANVKGLNLEEVLAFKEQLTVLLISGLFILLAARLDLDQLLSLGLPALLLLAVIQFVVRPISVFLCSIGTDLKWQERALIAWVGPRGIVAAAVSALFALRLEEIGYEGASTLTALTFSVIIGTVVFQSATARFVALRLGVTEPESRGIVIVGANKIARCLAEALKKQNIPSILIDPSWENISEARMLGLNTLHGNPLSSSVNQKLELGGYGQVLAITPQRDINMLSALHFREEFEDRFVYSVKSEAPRNKSSARHQVSSRFQPSSFGEDEFSFQKLSSLISQGASIRATLITSDYTLERWRTEHQAQRSLLMAVTPEGWLRIISSEKVPVIKAGWTVMSIDKGAKKPEPSAEKQSA